MTEALIAQLTQMVEQVVGPGLRVYELFIISGWIWLGIFLIARAFA